MNLNELYEKADYKDDMGMLFNCDCIDFMNNFGNPLERESKSNNYRYSL